MIEMIEMIEMIWGSAGRGCAFWCGSGGGRVGDMLNFGPLGSGVGYGFSLWLEGFREIVSPRFSAAPHTLTSDCVPTHFDHFNRLPFSQNWEFQNYELG